MTLRRVALVGVDRATGIQLGGHQHYLKVHNGGSIEREVVVLGDKVQDHRVGDDNHRNVTMVEASGGFDISGKRVCVEGDKASCGCPTTGSGFLVTE